MVEIAVEVVYALPKKQTITRLHVAENTTVLDAIHQSGILEQYPNIDLKHNKVGVFGKICALQDKLNDGDRVEIYRELRIDAKDARALRVKLQRNKK